MLTRPTVPCASKSEQIAAFRRVKTQIPYEDILQAGFSYSGLRRLIWKVDEDSVKARRSALKSAKSVKPLVTVPRMDAEAGLLATRDNAFAAALPAAADFLRNARLR